jgi:hypothetical protein
MMQESETASMENNGKDSSQWNITGNVILEMGLRKQFPEGFQQVSDPVLYQGGQSRFL